MASVAPRNVEHQEHGSILGHLIERDHIIIYGRMQARSQDWSEEGGGGVVPRVANVSGGGPTVHQISM